MRHSANLAILFALGTAVAFVGCSSSDDTTDTSGTPGTGGKDAGTGGHVATGGSDAGSGGSAAGGKDGGTGGTVANTGGTDAGSGGSATGGTDAGAGGTDAGAGGTDAGAGGTDAGAGGTDAGAGGTDAGAGGTDAGADAGGACVETVPTGIGALAAVVLVDDVQIKDAVSALVTEWQFADSTSIVDQSVYPPATGKWTRSPYPTLNASADAHDAFLACDGSPANGSLEATVPFAAKNEYFELMTTVTKADFSGYTVSAKVKLADGATCAAAYLYTINSVDPYHQALGTNTALTTGTWVTVSVVVPSDGLSTAVDSFVLNVNTYNCP